MEILALRIGKEKSLFSLELSPSSQAIPIGMRFRNLPSLIHQYLPPCVFNAYLSSTGTCHRVDSDVHGSQEGSRRNRSSSKCTTQS